MYDNPRQLKADYEEAPQNGENLEKKIHSAIEEYANTGFAIMVQRSRERPGYIESLEDVVADILSEKGWSEHASPARPFRHLRPTSQKEAGTKKGEHTAGPAQELRFPNFGIYHGARQCILHQWVPNNIVVFKSSLPSAMCMTRNN